MFSLSSLGVLQCVAVYCSVLQCVAVCCSVLHYVAVCCTCVISLTSSLSFRGVLQFVALCCSMVHLCHLSHTRARVGSLACVFLLLSCSLTCMCTRAVSRCLSCRLLLLFSGPALTGARAREQEQESCFPARVCYCSQRGHEHKQDTGKTRARERTLRVLLLSLSLSRLFLRRVCVCAYSCSDLHSGVMTSDKNLYMCVRECVCLCVCIHMCVCACVCSLSFTRTFATTLCISEHSIKHVDGHVVGNGMFFQSSV